MVSSRIGFFDLVDETVDAMETGDVDQGFIEGSDQNKLHSIVVSKGLAGIDPRIVPVAQFLELALREQVPSKDTPGWDAISYRVIVYENKSCFLYHWPDQLKIDFSKLRQEIGYLKNLLVENIPSPFWYGLARKPEQYGDELFSILSDNLDLPSADEVTLGPFCTGSKELEKIKEMLNCLIDFSESGKKMDLTEEVCEENQEVYILLARTEYCGLFLREKSFRPYALLPMPGRGPAEDDFEAEVSFAEDHPEPRIN